MTPASVSFVMHNPQQGHAALLEGWAWAKAQTMAGNAVAAEFRLQEDAKTDEQRAYYHVILTFIALHGRANGQKFPMVDWKEHYRKEYLGTKRKTFTDPMTGRKVRKNIRVSTEDLGVRGYARLIDRVTAHASTELNLTVPPPVRKGEIDPDSGEIR